MGDNGTIRETAQNNVDRKKYRDNYDKIFGKKSIKCEECEAETKDLCICEDEK